ncbi:hypothetical protein CKO25_16480 [Thiocapsa imhoffii]|uniref:PAS domain S-box protein n=1 Tax=Thiocapsa imhoffii TaxID=382777 RepID=A0A9X0WKH7_9GAMM|nr:PAS domain S-box protein [Thiocapsa imhoffii]MBK1646213.1 hypothetical protein [Thiocapsa imhoffii]
MQPATWEWLENLPVGTYELRIRPDGLPEFTHVSTRWLEICGLNRSQFMADQGLAIAVIHPDDRQGMILANREAMAQTQPQPFHWEGRLLLHDDRQIWVAISSNPRKAENGEVIWEGVMVDVTAYKRIELQLRENVQQLRLMLQHLPTAVLVAALSPEQPVLFSNTAFERVFGYTQLEISGIRAWVRLVCPHPEEQSATWTWWERALAEAIATNGRVDHKTLPIMHKDGSPRHVVMSATLVDDLLIASFEDVTESMRAQAAMARSEARFRALFESTSEAVMLLDARHFIDANQATLRLFGIADRETFCATHFADLSPSHQPCGIPSLELADQHIQTALREGSCRFEWVHCRSDSDVEIPCEVVLSALELEGERLLLATVRDHTERWRAAAERRQSQERLDAMLKAMPELMFRVDRSGLIHEFHSSSMRQLYLPPESFLGKRVAEVLPAEAADIVMAAIEEAATRGCHRGGIYSLPMPHGEAWYELSIAAMGAPQLPSTECVALVHDITRQKRSEEELRLSEQTFRTLVEDANDIIYTLNLNGEFQYLSPNLREILGFDPADFLGQGIASIVHPEDLQRCQDFLMRLLETRQKQSGLEYRVRHQDGHWRWHVTNASPLFEPDGKLMGMLGIAHDISERKANESYIKHLAHHDALTDLPNRTLFFDRLQQALCDAERNHLQVALMFIDLDRFKPINDNHGHDIGDLVLKCVAKRLVSVLRQSDCVGRIGGDEFLVLLRRMTTAEAVIGVADQIVCALREPVCIGNLQLRLSCSIGIALYPLHGRDSITLARRADQAMYQAKQDGRDQIRLAETIT